MNRPKFCLAAIRDKTKGISADFAIFHTTPARAGPALEDDTCAKNHSERGIR